MVLIDSYNAIIKNEYWRIVSLIEKKLRKKHYIYFVSDGKYIKIGKTSEGIKKRTTGNQTGNPNILVPLVICPFDATIDMNDCESKIHSFLHNYKTPANNEWYLLPEYMVYRDFYAPFSILDRIYIIDFIDGKYRSNNGYTINEYNETELLGRLLNPRVRKIYKQ